MDMPVWLRVFYIKEINKVLDTRRKQQEKQQRKTPGISRPSFNTLKSS